MSDAPDDDTVRVSAARGASGPARTSSGDVDPDGMTTDGSTVIARRESRRRQKRAMTAPPPVPERAAGAVSTPSGRTARTPDAGPAVSAVRAPDPVVVRRATPSARAPQDVVDTTAEAAARRRRNRRLVVIVAVAASVLVALAATALIVLLTIG